MSGINASGNEIESGKYGIENLEKAEARQAPIKRALAVVILGRAVLIRRRPVP
ncbi:hypothetical protein [Paraburkholderia caribensis]|uniref:hypothetical protein n=1 Tax=Paraburkholderia caribensis TaxID=75105 RepID=UPI0034D24B81